MLQATSFILKSQISQNFHVCIFYDTELRKYSNYPSMHMPVPFIYFMTLS